MTEISDGSAERVQAMLQKLLAEIGASKIKSVELSSSQRSGDDFSNAELAQRHMDSDAKRDVVTATDETAEKCAQAFVDVLELEIQRVLDRGAPTSRAADSLMSMGLRAAMVIYLKACADNISGQKDFKGDPLEPLSDSYAAQKKASVGFANPILVRTGQLRDALDPAQIAKNIKFTTKSGE